MFYNHQRCYQWLLIIILCLSSHITHCSDEEGDEEEKSYWKTFASVAGKVASSAGDTVYSAASSGASTISGIFNDEDDKSDEESSCDEEGCVESYDKTTSVERSSGIFKSVTSTVSSAWISTKEATGAALDGVRSGIVSEVDAVLGAVGNRIASALTPGKYLIIINLSFVYNHFRFILEYLITKGLSFLPSQLLSTIVFIASLVIAYIIASFVSIFTAISLLLAIYLIHAVTGPLWIISMMLMGLDWTLWILKCLVFYPTISAILIGLIFLLSIYWFYICPFFENRQRKRKIDSLDDNVRILMDTMDDMQKQQRQIYKMVKALHDRQMK